jgi:hypothetical protein
LDADCAAEPICLCDDAADCDDGHACSVDTCDAGNCEYNLSACPVATQGLASYWPLHSDTQDYWGSSDATNGGATNEDSAYRFDGSRDYIDLNGQAEDFFEAGDKTILLWVYTEDYDGLIETDNVSNGECIIGDSGNTIGLYRYKDSRSGVEYLAILNTIMQDSVPTPHIISVNNPGGWTHIGYVHTGDTTLGIHLNGGPGSTSLSSGATTDLTGDMYLGKCGDSAYYEGYIADVMVFNRGLTAAEITDIYDSTKDPYI